MIKPVFKNYCTDPAGVCHGYETLDMSEALAQTSIRRSEGNTFVTMVSENPQSVGKPGVAAIVDGKTPDGHDYEWSKAGRAGKPRKSDKIVENKDH